MTKVHVVTCSSLFRCFLQCWNEEPFSVEAGSTYYFMLDYLHRIKLCLRCLEYRSGSPNLDTTGTVEKMKAKQRTLLHLELDWNIVHLVRKSENHSDGVNLI